MQPGASSQGPLWLWSLQRVFEMPPPLQHLHILPPQPEPVGAEVHGAGCDACVAWGIAHEEAEQAVHTMPCSMTTSTLPGFECHSPDSNVRH